MFQQQERLLYPGHGLDPWPVLSTYSKICVCWRMYIVNSMDLVKWGAQTPTYSTSPVEFVSYILSCWDVVVVCCCCHINSHNQVRGHRTGSSHSGDEEYPRKKHTLNPRWYTHISHLTQFIPPPETYKSEIGVQSTMCQVQAGAYVSLLTPGETKYEMYGR